MQGMDYMEACRDRAAEMREAVENERMARSLRRSRRQNRPRKRDVLRFMFFPLSLPGDKERLRK